MESAANLEGGRLRHWLKLILIPTLLATLAGFLVSYAFPAKYTSTAEVLVEAPKISEAIVPQVYNEDLARQMNEVVGLVTSEARLRSGVEKLGSAKGSENVDDVISSVQQNLTIQQAPDISQSVDAKEKSVQSSSSAFYISYTGSAANAAREMCRDVTSMLIEEYLKMRQNRGKDTTDFLERQAEDAKQNLDDKAKTLAAFKNQHMGQLPEDLDSNMKVLNSLSTSLQANTQELNRAAQDKSYTESMLAQAIAAWKTSHSTSNPQTDAGNDKGSGTEPQEISQLRLKIHQYQDLIAQATLDQGEFQQEIAVVERRVAASPTVEEQYKDLARDYDNALRVYQDDLAKLSVSKMATQAEQQGLGQQMALLNPASLPDSPDFPNRFFFAVGGLIVGLAFGIGLAVWLRYRPMQGQAVSQAASLATDH